MCLLMYHLYSLDISWLYHIVVWNQHSISIKFPTIHIKFSMIFKGFMLVIRNIVWNNLRLWNLLCKKLSAGLWLIFLYKPAYKVGSWLESGNLDLGRVLTIPRTVKLFTVPKLFMQTMWFILNTYFFLLGI